MIANKTLAIASAPNQFFKISIVSLSFLFKTSNCNDFSGALKSKHIDGGAFPFIDDVHFSDEACVGGSGVER